MPSPNDSVSTDPIDSLHVCYSCNKNHATLRCTQCGEAWYCTRNPCQVAHWKASHKAECKQIANEKALAADINLEELQAQVTKDQLQHNQLIRQDQVVSSTDDAATPLTIAEQFPKGEFPCGELHAYRDYRRIRYSSEEARERERSEEFEKRLHDAREAAEVHRQARAWFQKNIAPGKRLIDVVTGMEDRARYLLGGGTFPHSGIAFATGVSVNECAAHYSPNPGDFRVLLQGDVLKVDLGVHKNGTIIDSAWTMCWEDKFKPFLDVVQEATEAGIRTAGVGVRLYDVGAAIQEVMESGEVELDGKTYQVQCIENLNGHNIGPYRIHHTKTVPIIRREYKVNQRMEEMEFFAIETFGSIRGEGYVEEMPGNSHYMLNYHKEEHFPRNKVARRFYKQIVDNFGTLCWTFRYMHRLGLEVDERALEYLIRDDIVNECPPLSDLPGSYTAQFEHTLCLRPTCKEILSRGEDY